MEEMKMEKEKYVFDADEFKDGFDDYVIENEYYDYDTVYDFVNESLEQNGMGSRYADLVEPLKRCNPNAEFLRINAYLNDIDQVYESDIYDEYITDNYRDEMKDPEFAKEVYDFLESELSSWEFKDFIKLRENRNDGYTPTTELEQGKEK